MSFAFHGKLLIGGLTLKDLDGEIDADDNGGAVWHGRFRLDVQRCSLLQLGRTYRLELDDGRAGQLVVCRTLHRPQEPQVVVEFDGCSPLR